MGNRFTMSSKVILSLQVNQSVLDDELEYKEYNRIEINVG